VTNLARQAVTFRRRPPAAERLPPSGSVFYIHLGTLVAQPAVRQIALSAPGWTFQAFTTPQYGTCWAAAPDADVVLPAGRPMLIAVSGLVPSPPGAQAQVSFDCYAIDGIDALILARARLTGQVGEGPGHTNDLDHAARADLAVIQATLDHSQRTGCRWPSPTQL
jgi:hypothetical protein